MKLLRLFILAITLLTCAPAFAGLKVDNVVPDPNGDYPGHSFLYRITFTSDANDDVCMTSHGCGNNRHTIGQICWVADPSATTCDPGNWYHLTGLSIEALCDTTRFFATYCMKGTVVVGRAYMVGSIPPSSGYWCAAAWQSNAAGSRANIFPNSCGKVGEAPLSCSISAPSVLAHGDLTLPGVGGKSVESTATLRCTSTATVKVRAIVSTGNPASVVPLRADRSITSTLTINGIDGATGANIFVTANTPVVVNLRSTLASTLPTVGTVQGNALLVVDVP
jgi:hypothetical protein